MKVEIEPIFITTNETAKLLSVHKSTLWRMVKAGVLKKHNLFENCIRFEYKEVLDYAKAKMEAKA